MTQIDATTEPDPFRRVIAGLDANFGVAPGRRAAHAKGLVVYGSFTATPEASTISRAGHLAGTPVEVVARFSSFPGGASHPDASPESNPRGLAVQFRLADGTTTDIVAHSINGFPGRTVEDFAEFLFAIAPGGPGPESYLADHPAAAAFVGAIQAHGAPVSYATLRYYAVSAFVFQNANGDHVSGRYTFVPTEGVRTLDEAHAAAAEPDYLAAELARRLDIDVVVFSLLLSIAQPGDDTADANARWPADRRRVNLGQLRLHRLADESESVQQGLFFDPVRLVDGISLSDDPLLVGRTRTYPLSLARRHQTRRDS